MASEKREIKKMKNFPRQDFFYHHQKTHQKATTIISSRRQSRSRGLFLVATRQLPPTTASSTNRKFRTDLALGNRADRYISAMRIRLAHSKSKLSSR
jgi:hypothetical protein